VICGWEKFYEKKRYNSMTMCVQGTKTRFQASLQAASNVIHSRKSFTSYEGYWLAVG
jgi:hypothetical protein